MNIIPFKKTAIISAITIFLLSSQYATSGELATSPSAEDLFSLSLEDLMNVQVTSMMKSPTALSDTPGAIFVLTNDDIRRTGATTIPEALRVVPGMHIARIDANKWAVTARGFNGQFASKLLVLLDGRSVYTPLFSGVWWDQQDVVMDDIERIEVIRGPGASLWGTNAVNGVINIITKTAKNAQGGLVDAHVGDERGGASLRYGAKVGDDAYLKVWGRAAVHEGETLLGSHSDAGDLGRMRKAGFRFDKDVSGEDQLTLQGDIFSGHSGGSLQTFPILTASLTPASPFSQDLPTAHDFKGYNLLGRWEHTLSSDSSTILQMYWDNHQRDAYAIGAVIEVDKLDIDFQHNLQLTERQKMVWGLGYRRTMQDTKNSPIMTMTDPHRSDDLYSLFIQDDITLVPQHWKLTLGSRFEYNRDASGFEAQPNVRLLWTPNNNQSVWASVARAARTPSWWEQDAAFSLKTVPPFVAPNSTPSPLMLGTLGQPNVPSEKLMAYELGWRGVIQPRMTADVALYYYDYKDVSTLGLGPVDVSHLPDYLLQTFHYGGEATARTYGGEGSLDWQVRDDWRLRASYSYFDSHFRVSSTVSAGTRPFLKDTYPHHQVMLWSQHQLAPTVNLDLNLRYVDGLNISISPTGADTPELSSYTALDARLAWMPERNLELSLNGRNLLEGGHFEYGKDFYTASTKMPREVFFNVKLGF